MYLIENITSSSGGDRVILRLVKDGEQALVTVSPKTMLDLGLRKGERISSELFDTLNESAELDGAIRKGLSILGYGINSVSRLMEKLIRHGYSRETATRACEELVSRGYIDEEKDALRLCDSMISKKYGPGKILLTLRSRGYRRDILRLAEEFLSQTDFSLICESLIRSKIKKIPENRDEMKKLLAKLTALGYNVSDIRRALERF